ncbi:MAG: hypothetical protein ACXABY_05440 [Candidatus Thorarchaeota archaeon]|jgi:hypothetical protein
MESSSVGHAWAILKGRRSGDAKKAEGFLNSLPRGEYIMRNRNESRLRVRVKKRKKLGLLNGS